RPICWPRLAKPCPSCVAAYCWPVCWPRPAEPCPSCVVGCCGPVCWPRGAEPYRSCVATCYWPICWPRSAELGSPAWLPVTGLYVSLGRLKLPCLPDIGLYVGLGRRNRIVYVVAAASLYVSLGGPNHALLTCLL